MTEGVLRASARRGGILEEWVLRPYPVAAILLLLLLLVLERSLEAWICPLEIVRLSLLVVREDLIRLLNLSFISSELCRDNCVLFEGKRAPPGHGTYASELVFGFFLIFGLCLIWMSSQTCSAVGRADCEMWSSD